jgi:hypothetical protein
MIAPLAKFIDWSALQMAYAVVGLRYAPKPKWKLEEALEFLNGPDFIPAASDPARIAFDGPRDFKFPTPRPGEVEENNIVYGRLYRCAERWQERPVIILLDGFLPSVTIPRFHCLPAGSIGQDSTWPHWSLPTIFNAVRADALNGIVWSLRGLWHRTSPRFAR